ncbi:MAG: hypothetical protein PHU65_06100 [Actinomycetota bacterium]|nr:hypothetical protein [Actinomycetota bacterium]
MFSLTGCLSIPLFDSEINDAQLKTEIKIEELDESSFDDQEILKENISEKIDSYEEIKFTEEIRDPFKPFFLKSSEEQGIQNQLILEKIYSDNENLYVEINFNSSTYKLKQGDQFAKIYQVNVINEDSIVLLKGDELITIYMNEIYYD